MIHKKKEGTYHHTEKLHTIALISHTSKVC